MSTFKALPPEKNKDWLEADDKESIAALNFIDTCGSITQQVRDSLVKKDACEKIRGNLEHTLKLIRR